MVATTSGGIAALGYEDHEGAPAGEMLAAAARIARGVARVSWAYLPHRHVMAHIEDRLAAFRE